MPEVEIVPTRGQISRLCYPQGLRLPALPKRDNFGSHSHHPGYHYRGSMPCIDLRALAERDIERERNLARWRAESREQATKSKEARAARKARSRSARAPYLLEEGNLPRSQYAFWRGAKLLSLRLAQCRFCGYNAYDESERARHLAMAVRGGFSHAKLTQFTAKLLLARRECVICGEPGNHAKWGVPICPAQICLDKFMFDAPFISRIWTQAVSYIEQDLESPLEGRIFCR